MTTITMTTTTNQSISPKAVFTILGPLLTSLIIGGFTLIWKMDKLTENLTYKFETWQTQSQVQFKSHDTKLDEHERRIRVLELEVALAAAKRR